MPNIKSAKKRVKIIEAKSLRNKAAKSELKTVIKKTEIALQSSDDSKAETYRAAVKKIDQAVAKGLLHRNTAARKKSKLALKLNQANA